MRRRLIMAVALTIILAAPAYAQSSREITEAEVAAALDARRAVSASLEETTARFEEAVADEIVTRENVVSLSKAVARLEHEIGTKRSQVKNLVVSRYMAGGSLATGRMFSARTFTDLPVQDEYYSLMNDRDLALLRGLESSEALHVQQQAQLDESLTVQQELVAEIDDLLQEILTRLEQADAEYNAIAIAYEKQEEEKRKAEEERKRREEEARKAAAEEAARLATSTTTTVAPSTTTSTAPPATTTTEASTTTTTSAGTDSTTTTSTTPPAPPPVITDGKTCPINAATSFSDTWGAPRSGGRTHKGVDMMAARGAPLVAIESGRITRTSNSSLGGISIYLTGDSGSRYYYAHLENFAEGIRAGLSVSVGDLVGNNGSSGNASYSAPHLHFQYAPPGSDWVNPYPLVKALCG